MVQGVKKITSSAFKKDRNQNKFRHELKTKKKAKKGNSLQLPNGRFRDLALDDR